MKLASGLITVRLAPEFVLGDWESRNLAVDACVVGGETAMLFTPVRNPALLSGTPKYVAESNIWPSGENFEIRSVFCAVITVR